MPAYAEFPRNPPVRDFRTILVQAPRGHHQAVLSPAVVPPRSLTVCLLGAAVTGIGWGSGLFAAIYEI